MALRPLATLAIVVLVGCGMTDGTAPAGSSAGSLAAEVEAVAERYGSYTRDRAEHEGYKMDKLCLDAAAFGLPASRGAMGIHASNEALLRGPIDAMRPQALMFDAEGRVLGVEYEILADAVKAPPQLFGRTFAKLPSHAGVEHEHYALHLWFVDNPAGRFDDFNPRIPCPAGSTAPRQGPGASVPPSEHGEGH